MSEYASKNGASYASEIAKAPDRKIIMDASGRQGSSITFLSGCDVTFYTLTSYLSQAASLPQPPRLPSTGLLASALTRPSRELWCAMSSKGRGEKGKEG